MNTVEGQYFDGRTSRRHPASLTFYRDGGVRLSAGEEVRTYAFGDLVVSARIGNTPRSIAFPDGSNFETAENDRVDELLGQFGTGRFSRSIHLLESRLRFIVVALVIVAVSIWGFVQYGIPALARTTAFALPARTSASIARGALEILDRRYLGPSELGDSERRRIQALFREVVRDVKEPYPFNLLFREGRTLGPNALALPAGTVIMTDELVALVADEAELVAVLAHEVGHVIHRHALRQAIQHSMVAALVILLTGDLSSTSTLVAAVPTLLVEARFSRAFEREADGYALDHLQREGIDPVHFANLMRRLDGGASEGSLLGYFSSHPPTPERIRRFENAPAPR